MELKVVIEGVLLKYSLWNQCRRLVFSSQVHYLSYLNHLKFLTVT